MINTFIQSFMIGVCLGLIILLFKKIKFLDNVLQANIMLSSKNFWDNIKIGPTKIIKYKEKKKCSTKTK